MDKQMFNELKESLKQAVAISTGDAEPARRIVYAGKEVAAIREGRAHEVKAARSARIQVRAMSLLPASHCAATGHGVRSPGHPRPGRD